MESLLLENEIYVRLTPVRKRQRARAVLCSIGHGLWFGAGAAVLLGVVNVVLLRWPLHLLYAPGLAEWPLHQVILPAAAGLILLLGVLLGAWLSTRRMPDWQTAAAAIDAHYRLHDRTTTALRFLDKPDRKPLEDMQIADCLEHLAGVDPQAVVRVGLPKPLPAGLVLLVAAVAATAAAFVVKPSEIRPVVPDVETATPAGPIAPEPATGTAAPGERLPADVDWRPAPSGRVVANRTNLLAGATLEQVVSQADQSTAIAGTGSPEEAGVEGGKPPETVLEAELLPLEHRRTIRRYFELLRPRTGSGS